MDIGCEPRNGECWMDLQEAPQTERKGTPKRRESARRTGLRILGPIQKIGMVNVHLVVHKHLAHLVERRVIPRRRRRFNSGSVSQRVYGFRKKIHLLFCNMNTCGGRKPK